MIIIDGQEIPGTPDDDPGQEALMTMHPKGSHE
jgi:hypothetical protein